MLENDDVLLIRCLSFFPLLEYIIKKYLYSWNITALDVEALIYSPPQITTADFVSAVPVADYFNSHPITATADADVAVAACLGKAHLTATAEQQQQL